jgi:hypothetical protein
MVINNNVCYYGQHIGCPYANDPNCRRCAERLTHAVNFMTVEANCTPTEVAKHVGNQSYALTFRTVLAGSCSACLVAARPYKGLSKRGSAISFRR